jgi:multisubunit Na+/H+ antiporter MnhC subunit
MGLEDARCLAWVGRCKEQCRDTRRVNWIQDLIQDLRHGLHMLANSSDFSAIVIGILAIGTGANMAIFSIVYAVLLCPPLFRHPDQLVFLFEAKPQNRIPSAFAHTTIVTRLARKSAFSANWGCVMSISKSFSPR